ncbi:MAG: N-acetyl-alpha-D-glucosaminyl L-malate synthase [Proteobacteria bacterium]|nr:MAG: N-acetyl-alpha-D-glucosaminyl L-malate synthase [Pseudomonadota bacterium]
MYDPRFRFTLLIVLLAFVTITATLIYYFFYKGLNWGQYFHGVVNIGGSAIGGFMFVLICTKFITFNKNKKTGFEASYVDETGTGFNFPVSLSKFLPELVAPPISNKNLSHLEAELIGFLNGFRNWPYDITGNNPKSLYDHAIEQWKAMRSLPNTGPLHYAAALAQDLSLIYAYQEKRKKFPLSHLCMIGPAKDETVNLVEKLIDQLNLRKNVTLTGQLKKKEWIELSNEYDIFLNTTNYDNQPITIIEAMALGLPIVSTNVGGIPNLLSHNKTAKLVEANDVSAMVSQIMDYLSNDHKRIQISTNAREFVEKKYCKEIIIPQWFEAIDETIKQKNNYD